MQTEPETCETIASTRCPSVCTDGTLSKSHPVTQTGHFVYPSPTDHKQIGGSRLRARADRTAYGSGAPGRTRVPPVALPGLPDQAADDDDRAGQRHPGVLHA